MEFRAVNIKDIPSRPLQGVTTTELAHMLFDANDNDIVNWDDLTPTVQSWYYALASRLLRDWPRAK